MRKLLLIGLLCLLGGELQIMGQTDNYTVKGKLSGMSEDIKIVVLNSQNGNLQFDTLKVENGQFVYVGKATQRKELTFMRLSKKEQEATHAKWKGKRGMILSGKFDLTFFVGPGAQIEIQGDQKDFPFVEVVSEDEFNQGMMELQHLNLKELKEINVLHDALNDAVLADDSVAKMDVFKQQNALRECISQRTMEWIASHLDREYAMWLYLNSGLTNKTVGELKQQFDRFSSEVQQSESGKKLAEIIRVRTALTPGAQAPDFTLKNIYTGEDIHLADYRGKYVLLDFWASWCVPCRKSHPHLIQINQKYKGENFILLGIASDRKNEVIKKAAQEDKIDWPQMNIYEKRDQQKQLNEMYDISAIPTKILIDPEGKIVVKYVGDSAGLDQELEKIFKK
ncbi:MAG TPA: AhpC/TSA family protein [Candidatus Butyricimonas faecavium]|nr:AhpC/TSA family protein [Candidatus Butyricimonas faecavium]